MCGDYTNIKPFRDILKQQWDKALAKITHYHIHIYYDEDKFGRDKLLAEVAAARLTGLFPEATQGPFSVGRVGPHTKNNIEVSVDAKSFGEVLQFLQMNNDGLSILIHPRTGDELKDHGNAAMWIGKPVPFNESFLDLFRPANDRKVPKI
jgi:DOPA 4,5-dioxygenase